MNSRRLKQGVSYWTYQKWFTLDELCKEAVRIGLKGIDLVTPDQYGVVQQYGLVPSMTSGTQPNTIPIGPNRLENHDRVLASLKNDITLASAAEVPNVITFSGSREGMPDSEGLQNCAIALNKIKGYAEEVLSGISLALHSCATTLRPVHPTVRNERRYELGGVQIGPRNPLSPSSPQSLELKLQSLLTHRNGFGHHHYSRAGGLSAQRPTSLDFDYFSNLSVIRL